MDVITAMARCGIELDPLGTFHRRIEYAVSPAAVPSQEVGQPERKCDSTIPSESMHFPSGGSTFVVPPGHTHSFDFTVDINALIKAREGL
jgi:hypothetical protein